MPVLSVQSVKPTRTIALRHVELLTGLSDTPMCVRLVHDREKRARKLAGTIEELWPTIKEAQSEGFGVFIVVNEGGHRSEEITRIRAVFIDADGKPRPAKWHLEPSFIVERTAIRWHAYWIIDELPLEQFERLQRQLAEYYGSDPDVHDLPRLMRLAGTLHLKVKDNPQLITLEECGHLPCDPGYSAKEVAKGLPAVKDTTRPRRAPRVSLDLPANVTRAITYVKALPFVRVGVGKHSDAAAYEAGAVLSDLGLSEAKASEVMLEHFNCEQKDPDWIELKMENAYRYAQNAPGVDAVRPPSETFAEVVAKLIGKTGEHSSRLISRVASEIEPEKVEWLWPGRFPRGKFAFLAGDGGLGKTTALLDIAARVSRGSPWPCNEGDAQRGSVIYFSAEDDAADTLIPRLMAAGADRTKIHFVEAVKHEGGEGQRTFHLHDDLIELERLIGAIGDTALVIFDPISSYFGDTDTWRNSRVRGVLEPVVKMASRTGIAVIGNTHLAKGSKGKANMRVLDSVALTATGRAGYMVIEDADDPRQRLFLPSKNSLGPPVPGLSFIIASKLVDRSRGIEGSHVAWGKAKVAMTADEALAAMDDSNKKDSAVDAAVDFLRLELADGPVASTKVYWNAQTNGHTEATLRRAMTRLRVRRQKSGMDGPWAMSLPDSRVK